MNAPVGRRTAALLPLLFVLLVGGAGCDLLTGSDGEPGAVAGTWALVEGSGPEYLEITSSTLTTYSEQDGGCYEADVFDIVSRDGDRFVLSRTGSDVSATYTLRRSGDDLDVTFEGTTVTYRVSDQDVSRLAVCRGAGADPGVVCSALPPISIGQAIDGELTTDDGMYRNRYFDLYGLTLSASASVQIDASSATVDTYLYLYEADGTLIAGDDDGGPDTNARIATSLPAGCYRIEVTSYFDAETGAYTLAVD